MSKTYQKASGCAGSKGVDFQINLLSVFLLNALKNMKDWRLSTENKLAGKFDDVVLELSDGSAILLQAKHKQNRKITLDQLLSTNSKNRDFSLPKYFFSYLEIKTKFPVKSIIICTNTQADVKTFKFLNQNSVSGDSMLHYQDGASFFTFGDDILPDLIKNAKIYHKNNLQGEDVDESVITEENVKEFLKHLQLYLKYPSGSDLEKVTERLLSSLKSFNNLLHNTSYRHLHQKAKDWFEQPECEYLTEQRAKAMFCEIKSENYRLLLEDYKVTFKSDDFRFTKSEERIFHVVAEGGYLLQLLKVYRSLQHDCTKILYAGADDGIEVQEEIIKAFELPLYIYLVIVSPKFSDQSVLNEICNHLRGILQCRRYKRVVFVAEQSNTLAQRMKATTCDCRTFDRIVSLRDFSEETQEKLLKKKSVVLQGEDVSLEELFPEQVTTDDYKKSIQSKILEMLVTGEKVTVGRQLTNLEEDISRYYVTRTFKRITGDIGNENEKVKEKNEIICEDDIFNVEEKTILISDNAGTGKTTVLTNLAVTIKKNNPLLWVVRIALNDYTTILRDSLKNGRSINVHELLNCKDATKLNNELEMILFSSTGRVVLMFDGVDEISPDYTDLILGLLLQSQEMESVMKVFITTRPYVTPELKVLSDLASFTLVPLTEWNQVDFLTNYWTYKLKLGSETSHQCERYARALINWMSIWMMNIFWYGRNNHFIAFPLQARMLAEIFMENKGSEEWEGCKEYLKGDEATPKLPEKMNIAKLYEMFVEKKRDIFMEKANPSGNTMANEALVDLFEECLAYHGSLALETILNEKKRVLFSCYKPTLKENEKKMLKVGIVHKLDGQLCFLHRTFAEYFVAEILLKEFQREPGNVRLQQFLIDELFLNSEFDVVCHFFNNLLQKFVPTSDVYQGQRSLTPSADTTNFKLSPPNLFVCKTLSRLFYNSPLESRLLKRRNRYTALHRLATEGHTEIIRLILRRIDLEDARTSKLHRRSFLAKINSSATLHHLVKRDIVNLRDGKGETALHKAIHGGHLDTVKFLVEIGASLSDINDIGGTALHLAVKQNEWDIVEYFLSIGVDIDLRDTTGRTALHSAVRGGKRNVVEFLVQYGARINIADKRGRTALHLTTCKSIVEFLLKLGSNINDRDKSGCTLLHFAAFRGTRKLVECLVRRGADTRITDKKGRTALHFAALGFVWNALQFLIERGMDVNSVDNRGLTVLHLAAQRGSCRMVEFLVKHGADVNFADKKGRTALRFASEGYYRDVSDFFAEYCPKMHVVTEDGWPSIVEFLNRRNT